MRSIDPFSGRRFAASWGTARGPTQVFASASWRLPGIVLAALAIGLPFVVLASSSSSDTRGAFGALDEVWGEHGGQPGFFKKPRAIAISAADELYVVDKSARIQVFDREGTFLRGWRTPEWKYGKPTGLSFDREGNLMVADTHYYRILFYTPTGELLEDKTIGGVEGQAPGQLGWVTDCVEDSQGNFYVSEYGELDRIQKFDANGNYLWGWGGHGDGPLEFKRPQNLALDEEDHLWVVDACNHRVMEFDVSGEAPVLLQQWGGQGNGPGELRYPYDLVLHEEFVYVCEYGNHRVQKFTRDGQSLATWGSIGRDPGMLHTPWAMAIDTESCLHIVDTLNQRVQRVRL